MAIKIPQVKEAGLPTTTGIRTPGADAFGAGVGQAVQGAGGKLFDIGLKLQNDANEAKARETDTYYSRKVNDLKNGYQQQTGKTAYESQQMFDKALADLRTEALDRLDNDAQKSMLAPLLDRKETEALQFGSQHAIKALHDWQVGELKAQSEMHTETAVANFGTEQGNIAIASLMENIEDLGDKNGWAPDVVENEKAKAMSGLIKTRIIGQLEDDPYGAEFLFRTASESGELSASDAATIANRVDGAMDKRISIDLAEKFLSNQGGDYQAAIEMTKSIEDADQREATRNLLISDFKMKKMFEEDAKKDLAEQAWNKLFAIEHPSARDLPDPGEVPADVRKSMETYIKMKQEDKDIKNNDALENMLTLMPDDEFRAWYRKNIGSHVNQFSPATQKSLKKRYEGDQKEIQVNVERSEIRRRAYSLADIGKKDEDGQVALATALDNAIQAAQEAKGKKLDPREMDEVIKQEVYQYKTRVYREGSGLLGIGREGYSLNEAIDQGLFKDSKNQRYSEADVHEMVKRMARDGQALSIENIQRQLDYASQKYPKK